MNSLETICDIYWKPILFGIAVVCAIIAGFAIVDAVQWLVAPDAKALQYVINMIGS